MIDTVVTWLLLPLGAALGWYLARNSGLPPEPVPTRRAPRGAPPPATDPDDTLAVLLSASASDSRSVEVHLTLGALFRRRGEVDRALKIHEALLARPDLDAASRESVEFELAQDYVKAGLMDRAEQYLHRLAVQGSRVVPALELLVQVYEQANDWAQALQTNRRLEASSGEARQERAAHYCCEQADRQAREGQTAAALQRLREARQLDPRSVRARLQMAALLEKSGDTAAAIVLLREVVDLDARFLTEALPGLRRCHEQEQRLDAYASWLASLAAPAELPPAAVIAQAELSRETGLDPQPLLAASLAHKPSWTVLQALLERLELAPGHRLGEALQGMRSALQTAAGRLPRYRCDHCGLMPSLLFWQCPNCKRWGSIAPKINWIGEP